MNDICDMTDKEWTPQEVKELAELAEQKGISKKKLAEEWLGVFPTTLSYWMATKKQTHRPPTPMAKRLMSCIEPKLKRLKDVAE